MRKKWIYAGVFAGIAALARLQGWLLAIPFFWLLLANSTDSVYETPLQEVQRVIHRYTTQQGWKEFFSQTLPRGWPAVVFPVLTYLGYSLWLSFQRLGSIAEAFSKYWSLTIVPPWVGFSAFVQRAISQDYTFNDSIDLVLFLIVTLLCILAIGKLRMAFSIYLWITLALILMRGHATHLFPGFMRYSMALFPVFWLIPKIVTNRYLELSLWILSLLVQFILLWMFLNWFWVV